MPRNPNNPRIPRTPAAAAIAHAVEAPAPKRSGAKLTVGCKLPHGLKLRIFRSEDIEVPNLGGGTRMEKRAVQVGETVTLKGNAVVFGVIPEHLITGGFAMTSGVDADFFREWMRQNKDSDVVKQGLIFAQEKADDASAEAQEKRGLRSGLEQIDTSKTSKDPRMLKGIETAETKAA